MNVISIEDARVVQTFDADEVTPPRGSYAPEIIRIISERYGIVTRPDPAQIGEGSVIFKTGRIVKSDRRINFFDIRIYNDGVAVKASNTDDASYVLDDVLTYLKDILEIEEPKTKIPRSYLSGIVVEFEISLESMLNFFERFSEYVNRTLTTYYDSNAPVSLHSLSLAIEELPPGLISREFRIERRVGRPHSENRFYCTSSFPTRIHIELLNQFEILAGER